jgi:hypothetical protein
MVACQILKVKRILLQEFQVSVQVLITVLYIDFPEYNDEHGHLGQKDWINKVRLQ